MKEYFVFLDQNRAKTILYFGVSLIAGLLEALGLISLVPALEAISGKAANAFYLLALPLATLICAISFRYIAENFQARILALTELRLRQELVSQIFFSPWARVRELSQGQITTGVVSESSQVANGVFAFLNVLSSATLVSILWASAFVINPSMALVTTIFLLFIAIVLRFRLRVFKLVETELRAGYQSVSEKVSGLLSEIKFIRLATRKKFWFRQISQQTSRLSDYRRKQIVLPATNRAIVESTASIFLIATLGIIAIQGVPISQGIVFLGIFYRLVPRLQSLQGYVSTSVGQRVWLVEWLKRRDSLGQVPSNVDEKDGKVIALPSNPELGSRVEVSGLTVIESGVEILHKIDLTVNAGTFLVITGRTGAGKTTLIDAMLGLRALEGGTVALDSQRLSEVNAEQLLSRVAVITQDVPLFSGTLGSNITCGFDLDTDWRDKVVEIASLSSVVRDRTETYESDLTSNGLSLSGGERQRLGLARALYQRPSLIVLDEATNGLDEETEKEVITKIRQLPWNITIIAISHRASLMALADLTLKLDDGRLVNLKGESL